MASGNTTRFLKDENGAVFLEFTVVVTFFLALVFGTVEFSLLYYRWNLATKATQLGARLAAVSRPVDNTLVNWTGMSVPGGCTTPKAGDVLPTTCGFTTRVCQGTGTANNTGTCSPGGTSAYDVAAMRAIVFGRGDTSFSCNDTGENMGMCDIYNKIRPQDVIVKYEYTGLGYAGRPSVYGDAGAPVPSITVSLNTSSTNLRNDFFAINKLARVGSILNIPSLATTITGEDLRGN